MKNHRFPWLRNRTTDNRKCEKARNIKEKRTIEMFSTVSKLHVVQASSQRDKSPKERSHLLTKRNHRVFPFGKTRFFFSVPHERKRFPYRLTAQMIPTEVYVVQSRVLC